MQPRLDHVHGLRGIAALAVIIQHSCQFVQDAGLSDYRLLLDHINLGRFGVVLFFLISGLVIPFSFRGETPLRNFALSRLFRLYPAYWLSIPILSYIAIAEYGIDLSLGQILANCTMMQGLFGFRNIGPGYWSLMLEMVFYMLCALLFWRRLLDDAVLNGIFVLIGLVSTLAPITMGLLLGEPGLTTQVDYFIAMFFLGMLLRRAFLQGCEVARKWSLIVVPLAIVAGVATSGLFYPLTQRGSGYLAPVPLASGMALPILVFVLVLWLKPKPWKAVMYLGTISYSLYLFQDLGLIFLRHIVPPGDWPVGYVLAVVAVSIAIASAVYRFVEEPMIEIGRRLTRRAPSIAMPQSDDLAPLAFATATCHKALRRREEARHE